MSYPILHFAHANSYPAGTYGMLFEQLRQHYDVRALSLHAHNPRFPVDDGWHLLAGELVEELQRNYSAPVILVGHSMGGILALMAARQRPDLARCVVLLDSPIVGGWRARALQLAKLLRVDAQRSPASASARRRNAWPDLESAYQHYAAKAMFAAWPQRVLRDYVDHGVADAGQGEVRLRFTREAETRIYRTIPHHLGSLCRRPFPVPVGFVGGIDSAECRLAGLDATRRLVRGHFRQIAGGHLFPMESPLAAAGATHAMIGELLASN